MHATEKHLQGLMGPVIDEGRFKLIKTMYHLTHLGLGLVSSFIF